jgi:hypothetical protein
MDHRRPHDGAERVDDARETGDGVFVALAPARVRVRAVVVAVTGAFAVYVLETVIGKERVRPLWGVIVMRGFASQGYGEGDLGFEARERFLQPEDLFCIGLANKGAVR